MTFLQKLERERTVVLRCWELDILTGLLTGEWKAMRDDPARRAYYETLSELRQKIIKANDF